MESIEAFVSHEAARISPRTARNFYGYPLKSLLVPFCEEDGITAVDELGPEVVDRFAGSLYDRPSRSGKPLSRATVLAYLKAVEHFLTWAQAQGAPVDGGQVQLPRTPRIRRDVLTPQEVERLEEAG